MNPAIQVDHVKHFLHLTSQILKMREKRYLECCCLWQILHYLLPQERLLFLSSYEFTGCHSTYQLQLYHFNTFCKSEQRCTIKINIFLSINGITRLCLPKSNANALPYTMWNSINIPYNINSRNYITKFDIIYVSKYDLMIWTKFRSHTALKSETNNCNSIARRFD